MYSSLSDSLLQEDDNFEKNVCAEYIPIKIFIINFVNS